MCSRFQSKINCISYSFSYVVSGGIIVTYRDDNGNESIEVGTTTPKIFNGTSYYAVNIVKTPLSGYTGWYVMLKNVDGTDLSGSYYSITLAPYPVKVSSTAATDTEEDNVSNVSDHEHNFEMTVILEPTIDKDGYQQLKCTSCEETTGPKMPISGAAAYVKMVVDAVKKAEQGQTIELNTFTWSTMNKKMVDALAARPDVSLTFNYIHDKKNYTVTIPAGADLASLLDENGFIDFQKLAAQFGGSEVVK